MFKWLAHHQRNFSENSRKNSHVTLKFVIAIHLLLYIHISITDTTTTTCKYMAIFQSLKTSIRITDTPGNPEQFY